MTGPWPPRTLLDKVWDAHVVERLPGGRGGLGDRRSRRSGDDHDAAGGSAP